MQDLVFFGATAFPEIVEIVRDINERKPTYRIVGILDDNSNLHGTAVEGVKVLGPLSDAAAYDDAMFVLGIGSYRARMVRYEIVKQLGIPRERYATLIHPAAKVYASAKVGHGTIIFPGAVVASDAVVGDFVQVLFNSVIGARAIVCDGALVTSLISTTADVILGPYCHIGTASAVGEGRKVGPGAQVAMGSFVLRDVPPGAFVFGNPPTILRRDPVPQELLDTWDSLLASRLVAR